MTPTPLLPGEWRTLSRDELDDVISDYHDLSPDEFRELGEPSLMDYLSMEPFEFVRVIPGRFMVRDGSTGHLSGGGKFVPGSA